MEKLGINIQCIPFPEGIYVILIEDVFQDLLCGIIRSLRVDCRINNSYYSDFLDYKKEKNIIEFRTVTNKFLQYNIKKNNWKTVLPSKSLIEKDYKKNDKQCMENNQLSLYYHLQGKPKKT